MDTPRGLLRSNFKFKIKNVIKSDFGYKKVLLVNASGVFFSLWGSKDLWRERDLGEIRLFFFFLFFYSFSRSLHSLLSHRSGLLQYVFSSALCCRQPFASLGKVSNVTSASGTLLRTVTHYSYWLDGTPALMGQMCERTFGNAEKKYEVPECSPCGFRNRVGLCSTNK